MLASALDIFTRDGYAYLSRWSHDFIKTAQGVSLYAAVLLAVTMFLNVWLVIWPLQKKVIANARNVQAGGQPDPDAPAAARRALMASRMNMIYSLPMLVFMVGTSHFPYKIISTTGSSRAVFWVIWIVIWGVLELNALGLIGGTAPGGTRSEE